MKRIAYDCSWSPPPSGLMLSDDEVHVYAIAEAEALGLLRRDADVEFKIDKEGVRWVKIKSGGGLTSPHPCDALSELDCANLQPEQLSRQ
jgi:hypothetical protein